MSTPQRWFTGAIATALCYVTLVACLSATGGPEVPKYIHSLVMGGLVVTLIASLVFIAADRVINRLVERLVEPVAARVATLLLNVIVDRVATRIVVLLGLTHIEAERKAVEAQPAVVAPDATPSVASAKPSTPSAAEPASPADAPREELDGYARGYADGLARSPMRPAEPGGQIIHLNGRS